jgi:hypothetical protein
MADLKPLTIWTVYHKDGLLDEYPIMNLDTHGYFDANGDDRGRGFNEKNPAWSELVAIFYIWYNNIASECVGINHYRRQFDPEKLPKKGEACVYKQYDWGRETVAEQFARHHGKEALYVTLAALARHDGDRYIRNLTENHILMGNCCFVMAWSDFQNMCSWLFPLLEEIRDALIGKPKSHKDELKRWRDRAVRIFGEDDVDYQTRCIAFIGERLISAWIMENLIIIETAR